ncbi:YceD family protein [Virgibacillus sp. MG-45]|uniref:YceD family protein n=1 Tax=Virgibacillus sp. MG-45 TaxID=3102791 RepID=UPI002EDA9A7B
MKFTLGQIKKNAHSKPFSFDGEVDVSELETMNNDIRLIKPVHVYGDCTMSGDQFIFSFTIQGEMVLPCARTLVDVPYPFEIKTQEIFSASPYLENEDEANEIHPVNGEVLDLTPFIKENILLEIPFRVFSDEANTENNIPNKGNGWEVLSEEISEKKIDPRLQKLESLLKDSKQK